MSNDNHLSTEQILDYLEGRLDSTTLAKINGHLSSGCVDCAKNLSTFSRMFQAFKVSSWPSPSTHQHNQAVNAFRQYHPERPKANWLSSLRPFPVFTGLALAILFIFLIFQGFPLQTSYAANLSEVSGDVEIKTSSSESWQKYSPGQSLPPGAMIRTLADSQVVMTFPNGDQTRLGANTQLELTALMQTDGLWQIAMTQTKGKTNNLSTSRTGIFKIKTSSGISETSRDNTDFSLDVNMDGTTVVTVERGKVKADSHGSSILISNGQSGILHPDNPPTTPEPSMPPSVPVVTTLPEENSQNDQSLSDLAAQQITPLPEVATTSESNDDDEDPLATVSPSNENSQKDNDKDKTNGNSGNNNSNGNNSGNGNSGSNNSGGGNSNGGNSGGSHPSGGNSGGGKKPH